VVDLPVRKAALGMKARFVVLTGVAGSGKTTVGEALARRLGWDFYDADAFHPAENISKMANGIPLTDADRAPWLASLHALISASLQENRPAVLACSALKESYRQRLLQGNDNALIVYLKGEYELIWSRLSARQDHYMEPQLLQSQFDTLEEPVDVLTIDVSKSVERIVEEILSHVK
jgi:gluconokinase